IVIHLHDIRYVRLGTSDLDGAVRYATDLLGLQVAHRDAKSVYFKSDSRDHTLCYFEGDPRDHTAAFEVDTAKELSDAAELLEAKGYKVHQGTATEAEQRHVREFIAFNDPSGNRIELVYEPHHSGVRYFAPRDAGITGFSHIGLRTL